MTAARERFLLFCILASGMAARLIKFSEPVVGTDVAAFARLGKNLVENGAYSFGENYNMGVFFPPAYSTLVGMAGFFFDDLFFAAKLVSVIAGGITIVVSYFIGKELYGREAGFFAAVIFACYPLLLIVSLQAWSDSLFICLLLLSISIFTVILKRDGIHLFALFGLSAGVTYLTRPEGMFLLLLPLLYLFGVFGGRAGLAKKRFAGVVVAVALFAASAAPYVMFLKEYTGKYVMSGKSNISILLGELSGDRYYHQIVNAPNNLYDRAAFSMNEEKDSLVGWNRDENLSFIEYLLSDPARMADRYVKNMVQEVKLLVKLLIPLVLPLFFFFFDRKLFEKRANLVFFIFPLIYFLIYPLFIIIEKQTLLIVVFAAFPASYGFSISGSALSGMLGYYDIGGQRAARLLGSGVKYLIVVTLLLSSLSYFRYSSFDKTLRPVEHKNAGDYLKRNVSAEYEKLNVMSRKPLVSFFSGARFTMLPYAGSSDVVDFARLHNVDYIAVDERLLSEWEHYDELIRLDEYSPDAELVFEESTDMLIRLFRIRK